MKSLENGLKLSLALLVVLCLMTWCQGKQAQVNGEETLADVESQENPNETGSEETPGEENSVVLFFDGAELQIEPGPGPGAPARTPRHAPVAEGRAARETIC